MSKHDRKIIAAMLLAVIALPATTLRAAEQDGSGFYLGAATGQARYQLDDGYYAPVPSLHVDLDQSSAIHAIHAGWQANRFLAVELTLADLGNTAQFTKCSTPFVTQMCVGASGPFRMSTERADLSLVTTLPLGPRWELLGKMGLARYKHELSEPRYDGTAEEFKFVAYDDRYDTMALLGIGLRFRINEFWALRAQWDRATTRVSSADTRFHEDPETEFDTYLVGVEYRLGH